MHARIGAKDFLDSEAKEHFVNCFSSIGCVILQGQVPSTLSKFVLSEGAKLFSQKLIDKKGFLAAEADAPGFMPFGAAKALDTGVPNLLESWTVIPGRLEKFPDECRDLLFQIEELIHVFCGVAMRVLTILEEAYKIEGLLKARCDLARSSCHIINYPTSLASNGSSARRQSIHKDSSLLTLSIRASSPGLMIKHQKKGRVQVDLTDDEIIVMAGCALEHLTAGHIKACLHTVEELTPPQDRVSIVFFVPSPRAVILKPVSYFGLTADAVEYPPLNTDLLEAVYRARVYRQWQNG